MNSTNEALDESVSSPGLHNAAGPGLAEECATLGTLRMGDAVITSGYNLPARRVIHTVGPKYVAKFHTAVENALSNCYRVCLELLIEHGLTSIAFGCVYKEESDFPREAAAHIAIRTVRRFLEKHMERITAVVFCTYTLTDTEIYKRLLPLYFPRDKGEEDVARQELPADTGGEYGGTVCAERNIRISALPSPSCSSVHSPAAGGHRSGAFLGDGSPARAYLAGPQFSRSTSTRQEPLEALLDPSFMMMTRDPDVSRREQWERAAYMHQGGGAWSLPALLGLQGLGGPPLSAAEEDSVHARYLARANRATLSDIADMKILYRGGVDAQGRALMLVLGAHFLRRSMDLDLFVLHAVKEMEQVVQQGPYVLIYFHSLAHLPVRPDFGWMKRLHHILGRKHRSNLHAIYMVHPTIGLRTAVLTLQLLVEPEVWKKVKYFDRLKDLFKQVPRDQLTIPDFVFQHDLELSPPNLVSHADHHARPDTRRLLSA